MEDINFDVIEAASRLSGDMRKAQFWYDNEPLPPFDNKTPKILVSEGRTQDVLQYLAACESGFLG